MTPAPRAKKTLTEKFIDGVKAPGSYADAKIHGLQFRVRESGAKGWNIRYRVRDAHKRLTLGGYPALSLADARERAKTALRAIDDGNDPQTLKVERRQADTFGELAKTYIEKHAMKKKRSWKEDQRILNTNVLPLWKDRLARDIKRRDVRELVENIAERTPIMANRVVALISKMFTFALDREIVETSPAVRISRPGMEIKRDRVLTDDEIRQFWTATEALDAPMRAFYRLRLLTAQRGIEVATMKWGDIDLDAGWWTIPASVAKNKLSHRVPLSQSVLDVLNTLPTDTGYVLDGARGKRQQAEAAATFDITDFRGHDLRRTAATRMASAGIQRLVIGKVLNHVEPGVTAIYDRHGYDAEKKIALDAWARTLDGILKAKPAAVLPFTGRGR